MKTSVTLGRILGIPIGINFSWLFIFFFVTASTAFLYHQSYPEWSRSVYVGLGLLTSLLFFGSLLAHELTHSIVARRNGIPVKSITLFIFGGVAQISREAARPRTELIMAAAGPASSLVMAGFFGLVWWLFQGFSQPATALAQWLGLINLSLAGFNMIPGFPLDGGRVFRSILWGVSGNYRTATRVATLAGQGVGYLFIFGGLAMAFGGHWWIFQGSFSGIWLAVVGWFLENAASSSYRQSLLRDTLQGLTAADVMEKGCVAVPSDITVGRLVQDYILPSKSRCFMVAGAGRLDGMVALNQVKSVPRARWESITVGQAMVPADRIPTVRAEAEAVAVLERLQDEGLAELPVVRGQEVVGIVSRDTLLEILRTRSELGM